MKYLARHENTSRGTYDFPLELYHVDNRHPRYEMPFHWHMEGELMLIQSGAFSLSVDGKTNILYPGDAAFISSGSVHGGMPHDCVYECLVFDLSHFIKNNSPLFHRKYCELFNADTYIHPFYKNGSDFCQLIHCLFKAVNEKLFGYEFSTIGYIWQLYGIILSKHTYTPADSFDHRTGKNISQIKTVLNYIRKNYSSHLTLSELSDVVNMSPEHFCRIFHTITGKSPIDYLNYYRIECACELLSSSYKSITEVAYSCGFNDLSYFNRIFRKYKNMTPGSYQKTCLLQ